jgi:hypothetical protein
MAAHDFLAQGGARFAEVVGGSAPTLFARVSLNFPWPWTLSYTHGVGAWRTALAFYSPWLLLLSLLAWEVRRLVRYREWNERILAVLAVAYAQYLQVFPNSDLSHYARATMTIGPVFAYAFHRVWQASDRRARPWRPVVYGLSVGTALALHVSPFLSQEADTVRSLARQGYPPPSRLPFSRCLRTNWKEPELLAVTGALQGYPAERMFVAGNSIVYHLLAGKQSVVGCYNTTPVRVRSVAHEDEIVRTLAAERIDLVLKCPPFPDRSTMDSRGLPVLWGYITNNFVTMTNVHGYAIMARKGVP